MIINRLILFFALAIYSVNIYSQNYIPYYNLVNEAEYQMYLGKNDLAFGLYNKAFSIKGVSPKAKDLYFLGMLYLERKNLPKATDTFKKIFGLPDGTFSFWATKQQTYFLEHYSETELQVLISEAKEKEDRYYASVKNLQDSLSHFMEEDQRLRKVFTDSIKPRFNEGHKVYDLFMERVDSNDYENQVRFLSFIKKNGYPGLYLIGSDGAASILMHTHCKLFDEYQKVLYELLKKGKVEPFHYAHMVDRVSYTCKGRGVYNDRTGCDTCLQQRAERLASIDVSKYFKDSGTRPYVKRQLFSSSE